MRVSRSSACTVGCAGIGAEVIRKALDNAATHAVTDISGAVAVESGAAIRAATYAPRAECSCRFPWALVCVATRLERTNEKPRNSARHAPSMTSTSTSPFVAMRSAHAAMVDSTNAERTFILPCCTPARYMCQPIVQTAESRTWRGLASANAASARTRQSYICRRRYC